MSAKILRLRGTGGAAGEGGSDAAEAAAAVSPVAALAAQAVAAGATRAVLLFWVGDEASGFMATEDVSSQETYWSAGLLQKAMLEDDDDAG